jgi:hypothetical protein
MASPWDANEATRSEKKARGRQTWYTVCHIGSPDSRIGYSSSLATFEVTRNAPFSALQASKMQVNQAWS